MNVAHFCGGFIFFVEFICFHGRCDFFSFSLIVYSFVFREGEGGVGDFYQFIFFVFCFLLVNFREKLYICVMVSVDFSNHEKMKQVMTQLLIFAFFYLFFYLDLMSKGVGKIKLQVYSGAVNSCMVVTDLNKVIIYLVLIFVACIQER